MKKNDVLDYDVNINEKRDIWRFVLCHFEFNEISISIMDKVYTMVNK
jgi:hypothetical protein